MTVQTVFKRYELKYLVGEGEKSAVLAAISAHMSPDEYGDTTVRSIYLDTESFRLARRSLERPEYKEKLRVRSYRAASCDDTVFVELKKKYRSVVYKRRVPVVCSAAARWLAGKSPPPADTQITREIDYFLHYYGGVFPAAFISYDRRAFVADGESGLRVTFDQNILARTEDIDLHSPIGGTPLLGEGLTLMECKCTGGMPLWLVEVLSENRIYKTSFSKYGAAYEKLLCPQTKEKETTVYV